MKKYSVGSNEELQKNSIVTVEEARKAKKMAERSQNK